MIRLKLSGKICVCILLLSFTALTGCAGSGNLSVSQQTGAVMATEEPGRAEESGPAEETMQEEETMQAQETAQEEENMQEEGAAQTEGNGQTAETPADEATEEPADPVIEEADWSAYFNEINGSAVVYDPDLNCYLVYNQELAETRRSPCSTFKIISSLIALENGIITQDHSMRTWSGETFWNEAWNRDINFLDAFQTSCVWYFREVVDEIGKDTMEQELERLKYGNCDISDWEGRLNTNNNNPALTGFWIESSLLISPMEQVQVMERIFGENTDYSEETLEQLKQAMLLPGQKDTNALIYGKTGMGKDQGVTVDAWFTGFADISEKRIFFCVYLGRTDHQNVSSTVAKETAIKIISDYYT